MKRFYQTTALIVILALTACTPVEGGKTQAVFTLPSPTALTYPTLLPEWTPTPKWTATPKATAKLSTVTPISSLTLTSAPSPTAPLSQVISQGNAKQVKLLRQLGPSPVTETGIGGAVPSPDGKMVAVFWNYNPKFELWDLQSGQVLQTFDSQLGPARGPSTVAFSPDGKILALVSKDVVQLLNVAQGQLTRTYAAPTAGGVAFSPDGKLLAASFFRGGIQVWDAASGQELMRLENKLNNGPLIFDPSNSRRLALVSTEQVQVWDLTKGSLVQTILPIKGHPNVDQGERPVPFNLAFSSDGRLLAVGYADGIIEVWNLETNEGRILYELEGSVHPAFNPKNESDVLAIGIEKYGSGGDVLLLNPSGEPNDPDVPTLYSPRQDETLQSVAFTPDGKYLVTAARAQQGDQGKVYVWGLEP